LIRLGVENPTLARVAPGTLSTCWRLRSREKILQHDRQVSSNADVSDFGFLVRD